MRILSAGTDSNGSFTTCDIRRANKIPGSSSSPIYRRDHLHTLLDELSATPLIVLNARSGSGKTTFMADYAARHPSSCIWYCATHGADVGSILHGLVASASESHLLQNQHEIFWALQEADATNLATLRHFFSTFLKKIPAPLLIVIDNFQQVQFEDAFHDVLCAACQGLPKGGHIVIVNSGTCYLNLQHLRKAFPVAVLENQDFKLNAKEVAEIAKLYGRSLTSPIEARRLLATVEGCASCLIGILSDERPLTAGSF